jgi:UPF0042 nucleotide-binding protein
MSEQSGLIIIVTGLSGAGHSTALKALEDSGIYCIDNLPLILLQGTVEHVSGAKIYGEKAFAFGMDVRSTQFAEDFLTIKEKLANRYAIDVLFLTADPGVIATRFNATRRRHPLVVGDGGVLEAIEFERSLLAPVEEAADLILDTSKLTPSQLARAVEARYSSLVAKRRMLVSIASFGFKYGQLESVDTMFDVRFLRNPNYEPELKPLTGLDKRVSDYVFRDPAAEEMFRHIDSINRFMLPRYYKEGKNYFRIGIGCSGGKHRSVAFAQRIGQSLQETPIKNLEVQVQHRDITR